ncbi:MAG: VCBS domain-containing protein, partial [Mycobacterium sp.]|nr:VCBS domain-containing protein [Mycobacterium sp.]
MDATMFVARLGPLTAMVGVGTAIVMGGGGVAAAEPSSVGVVSSTQPEGSATLANSATADTLQPGGGSDEAGSSAPADTDSGLVPGVDPVGEFDTEDADQTSTATSSPDDEPVTGEPESADLAAPEPVESDVMPVAEESAPVERARSAAVRSESPRAQANAAANPFATIAALFDNQTPTLDPTQTGQTDGVVTGQLNVADPDSSRQTYTVTDAPARGSVVINSDGSYRYTVNPTFARSGTTDSFRVTVSDAASGFHIHGLLGWINLLSFGLFGSSRHTSTSTVSVTVAPFVLPEPPPTNPPPTNPPPT